MWTGSKSQPNKHTPEFGRLIQTWRDRNVVLDHVKPPANNELAKKTMTELREWGTAKEAEENRKLQRFIAFLNKMLKRYDTTRHLQHGFFLPRHE